MFSTRPPVERLRPRATASTTSTISVPFGDARESSATASSVDTTSANSSWTPHFSVEFFTWAGLSKACTYFGTRYKLGTEWSPWKGHTLRPQPRVRPGTIRVRAGIPHHLLHRLHHEPAQDLKMDSTATVHSCCAWRSFAVILLGDRHRWLLPAEAFATSSRSSILRSSIRGLVDHSVREAKGRTPHQRLPPHRSVRRQLHPGRCRRSHHRGRFLLHHLRHDLPAR